MTEKIKVGLLFGGMSSEYEVSVNSAFNIYNAIDKNKYEVYPMGMTKDGYLANPVESNNLLQDAKYVVERPHSVENINHIFELSDYPKMDVFFPIIHGNIGEDGAIQGLFRVLDVPFVGSDVLGAAATMDKDFSKILAEDIGLKVADWIVIKRPQYEDQVPELVDYDLVSAKLGKKLFIKPSNQGSSVGISPAHNAAEYAASLAEAFKYDDKVLVEEAIDMIEVETAVLGNDRPIVSGVGQIVNATNDYYTYENKYDDSSTSTLQIPAAIPDEARDTIREQAIAIYQKLEAFGLARVDFMLEKGTNEVIFNELNALPGFTNISMYPKLFEQAGIPYSELIDRLIQLGIERHNHKTELSHNVD